MKRQHAEDCIELYEWPDLRLENQYQHNTGPKSCELTR